MLCVSLFGDGRKERDRAAKTRGPFLKVRERKFSGREEEPTSWE